MGKPGPDPTVTDDELIEIVEGIDMPVVTAVEVADVVDLSRRRVGDQLNRLSEEGRLERGELGANTVIYWSPPEE